MGNRASKPTATNALVRAAALTLVMLLAAFSAPRSAALTGRLLCRHATPAAASSLSSASSAAAFVPSSVGRKRRPAATATARRFIASDDGAEGDRVSDANGTSDAAASAASSRRPLSHSFSSLGDRYSLPSDCPVGLSNDVLTDLRPGRRIVSFGDVHGDTDALRNFLVTARVMDPDSTLEDPVWNGGDAICVQVGDILDRGDDELACLRALASLSQQAKDAGGALVMLYGNHESLNCAGLFQYANPGGNVEFEMDVGSAIDRELGTNRWRLQFAGNQPSRWAMYEPGGLLAEAMLANLKVAVVVGRTVFVHAGLTAEHLRRYGGIEGMNRQARDWILKAHHHEHNQEGTYQTVEEVIHSAQNRARAISGNMPECLGGGIGDPSPVWMRDYSQPSDGPPKNPAAQSMLDECLAELGRRIGGDSDGGAAAVRRMVMGHTPQRRINAALDGKAIRVDVGASRGVMGGTPEVLEIVHGGDEKEDEVYVLTMDGERIWMGERQVLEAGPWIEQLF